MTAIKRADCAEIIKPWLHVISQLILKPFNSLQTDTSDVASSGSVLPPRFPPSTTDAKASDATRELEMKGSSDTEPERTKIAADGAGERARTFRQTFQ
jgi:hypothetical protein